ncbi:MAG TPA: hypothetical protein VN380_14930 [Thermoanaerobaculia bacterium]|jgi:hypothetical protein|nr:hypothetical protein [Thermoanaerobaculia bacterium]
MPLEATDVVFGCLVASLVALLVPGRSAPWYDLDALLTQSFRVVRRAIAPEAAVADAAFVRSSAERARFLKGAVSGIALILLLPLHHWTGTQWAVDWLWYVPDWTRHTSEGLWPALAEYLHEEEHYWRNAPYQLWEICVFVWAIPFLSGSVRDDCVDWLSQAKMGTKSALRYYRVVSAISWTVAVVGAATLVVLQNPFVRLSFELGFVAVVMLFDLWFAWKYYALRRHLSAVQFMEIVFVIDLPAVVAFTVLLLFMRSSFLEDLPYRSHWSSPFVAGASALNLMFASSATIVLKTIHAYRRAATDANVASRETAGDEVAVTS